MKKLLFIILLLFSIVSFGQVNFFGTYHSSCPSVGDSYGGGIVAYLFVSGDAGYFSGECHGLIAATTDQSISADWGVDDDIFIGTDAVIGSGLTNTNNIIAHYGAGSYAAYLAYSYGDGWFLPSIDELQKLYNNRMAIGNFDAAQYVYYLSSTERAVDWPSWVRTIAFYDGSATYVAKTTSFTVKTRAIRYF